MSADTATFDAPGRPGTSAAVGWLASVLFYALPFVDAITGYLVLSGRLPEGSAGSLSQLIRGLLLPAGLLLLSGGALRRTVLAALYFAMIELIVFLFHQNATWLIIGTIYDFKIVFLLVAYFVFRRLQRRDGESVAVYFVRGATLYGLILVATTLAGIHSPTYGEGTSGTKGTFASGNALSMYLGCAALVASQLQRDAPARLRLATAWFLAVCCVVIGTKASMIFGAAFLALRISYLSGPNRVLAVAGVALLAYLSPLPDLALALFDVIAFRFEGSDSLFAFLASGRDGYVSDAVGSFDVSGYRIARILFGTGSYISFRDFAGPELVEYDTLESDFFDVFFAYGAIGSCVYVGIIAYGLILAMKARQAALVFAWLSVCAYSAAAGHVLFNAMSGMALPVLILHMRRLIERQNIS